MSERDSERESAGGEEGGLGEERGKRERKRERESLLSRFALYYPVGKCRNKCVGEGQKRADELGLSQMSCDDHHKIDTCYTNS